MLSPISNESRLCSLKATNRAPWAVIREKVFNTGQVATGGHIDWQIATWQLVSAIAAVLSRCEVAFPLSSL